MENLDTEVRESCENTNFDIDNEANLELDLDGNCGSNSVIHIPQVSDEVRPKKGQQFKTLEDVLTFYKNYAKIAGFNVRSSTTKKEPGSEEIRRKEYICSKEGKSSRIAEVGKKRRRGSIGEECKAKIAVLKSNSGKYIVTVLNEGHSHPLSSPTKTHLLGSHCNVSAATESLTKQLSMSGSQMGDEGELMKGDRLILRGLMFHGFHGVKPEERKLGQKFLIDIDAWMDLRPAGKSDNLSDTVSYTDIYRIARDVVEGAPQNLLESVAELITSTTLTKFPGIMAVRVKVGKPHVAVVGPVNYLGVEIVRYRNIGVPV